MVIITEELIKQLLKMIDEIDEPRKNSFQNLHQGYSSETLVRFLAARDGSVSKAHKMLDDCLNWRIQNEIDNILAKPIIPADLYREVRDSQLIGMSGYSKEGLPVIAVGVGLSTYDKASTHYYVQSHIQINEYRDRVILPFATKKYGKYIGTCVKVLDMTGLRLSALNQIKLLTVISTIDDLNYPEKTETYYIVNAPYIFSACWKVVKPLLHERTRNRVQVLSGCGRDELLKIMDYESLPHFCKSEGSGSSRHSRNGTTDDCFSFDHDFHRHGNDVELMCKTLQVEHKLFYFDLKENPRGRYLKISEKTSSTRSTIIVPSNGISWFLDLFNYYVHSHDHPDDQEEDIFSKELQLDTKVFYFDIGENRRGRFLKVSEASVSRNRSTIIVPAGSAGDEGWAAFRNILAEINEAANLFILPNQQNSSEPPERIVGLSDDVGAGFISGHSSQHAPASDLSVDRSVDLPPPDEIGNNLGVSKVIRADQKRFFFDLGSNNRGHFLRISEVAGSDRSSIILPLSGLKQFYEMVGHFVEITKDRIEGMSGATVRTVDPPPQR